MGCCPKYGPYQSCSLSSCVRIRLIAWLGLRMAGPACVLLESGLWMQVHFSVTPGQLHPYRQLSICSLQMGTLALGHYVPGHSPSLASLKIASEGLKKNGGKTCLNPYKKRAHSNSPFSAHTRMPPKRAKGGFQSAPKGTCEGQDMPITHRVWCHAAHLTCFSMIACRTNYGERLGVKLIYKCHSCKLETTKKIGLARSPMGEFTVVNPPTQSFFNWQA